MEKIEKLKYLREKTNRSVSDCNKALFESNFDIETAYNLLQEKAELLAKKKEDRMTKSGIFGTYTHKGGKLLAVVELLAETDFVAKNSNFKQLAQDLAAQVLFSSEVKYISKELVPEKEKELYNEKNLKDILLLNQPFYKDETITIKDLINRYSATFGEKLEIANFYRFEII